MARSKGNLDCETKGPFDVMFGSYEVGRFRVPYMICTLSADECDSHLNLASEDAELTLASGKVEELFQRDIDHERVAQMADQYLSAGNASQRPPFFNSITIALLYRGAGKDIAPTKSQHDDHPHQLECGPALVRWYQSHSEEPGIPRPGSFGTLYWNKYGVKAVAIDGQHRLAALQLLAQRNPAAAKKIRVSLIVLLLDEKFGVKADGKSQIELMRSLFIDLNKHAQRVSRARQLLLDDSEPLAVSLRATIGPELRFQATQVKDENLPIGSAGEFSAKLPLSLVDWHGEQRAKVDTGPYVVSVLGLEWALEQLCKSKRFGNRMVDLAPLSENAELLNGTPQQAKEYFIGVREKLASWLRATPEIDKGIRQAESNRVSFHPDSDTVRIMGESIAATWGPAITKLICTAAPYRRLVDHAITHSLLNGQFSAWYQASYALDNAAPPAIPALEESKQRLEQQMDAAEPGKSQKFRDRLDFINHEVKSIPDKGASGKLETEPHLLFSLTGQRAMFLALRQAFDAAEATEMSAQALADEWELPRPSSDPAAAVFIARSIGNSISHWDEQLERRFFAKSARVEKLQGAELKDMPTQFWRGSLLKRESLDAIDFTTIAAERTARTLRFLWAVWQYRQCNPAAKPDCIEAWMKSGKSDNLRALDESATGAHLKKSLLSYVGLDQYGQSSHDTNKYPLAFLAKYPIHNEEPLSAKLFPNFAWTRIRWAWGIAK